MASYTSVYAPVIPPDADAWQTFTDTAPPAHWSKAVPAAKDPIVVVVSEPSGQVSFG
ncbi:MAG TPA: hypothetical protein VIY48_18720 [Candidatus Paceibacterota bacterium]